MISGAFGNGPNASGTGVVTFTKPIYAFLAKENTTASTFKDANDNTVTTHWENVQIDSGDLVIFQTPIKKMTVSAGGKGIIYFSE